METLAWAVRFACTPVFYVIDWLFNDNEYDQLVAEQHQRNIDRSFEGE